MWSWAHVKYQDVGKDDSEKNIKLTFVGNHVILSACQVQVAHQLNMIMGR